MSLIGNVRLEKIWRRTLTSQDGGQGAGERGRLCSSLLFTTVTSAGCVTAENAVSGLQSRPLLSADSLLGNERDYEAQLLLRALW